jgi:hypothetical protein
MNFVFLNILIQQYLQDSITKAFGIRANRHEQNYSQSVDCRNKRERDLPGSQSIEDSLCSSPSEAGASKDNKDTEAVSALIAPPTSGSFPTRPLRRIKGSSETDSDSVLTVTPV